MRRPYSHACALERSASRLWSAVQDLARGDGGSSLAGGTFKSSDACGPFQLSKRQVAAAVE